MTIREITKGAANRKEKRYFRKMGGTGYDVYLANLAGQHDRYYRRPPANNYPKGRRHEAYNYGYKTMDELAL